jgi:hypothetical protein
MTNLVVIYIRAANESSVVNTEILVAGNKHMLKNLRQKDRSVYGENENGLKVLFLVPYFTAS